jgi:hypothetical protein
MKFRKRKDKFYSVYGKRAYVFCNEHSNNVPVAEYSTASDGAPHYFAVTNRAEDVPSSGLMMYVRFNRNGNLTATKVVPKTLISKRKSQQILSDITQMLADHQL